MYEDQLVSHTLTNLPFTTMLNDIEVASYVGGTVDKWFSLLMWPKSWDSPALASVHWAATFPGLFSVLYSKLTFSSVSACAKDVCVCVCMCIMTTF